MSIMPDTTRQRGVLPRPHAGKEASDQPRPTSGERQQGCRNDDHQRPRPISRQEESVRQDRKTGIQNYQDQRSHNAAYGSAVYDIPARDQRGREAKEEVHVGV